MASEGMAREHSAEIADYIRQIEGIRQDVRELIRGLSEDQLRWRPDDRSWSVLECIAHLTETAKQYAPAIGSALDRARANGWFGDGPFRYGILGRWFTRSMEPPAKLKVKKTPFPPAQPTVSEDVLSDFERRHADLIAQISSAEGIDLARAKVQSPASRFMKLSLGVAFAVLAAHGRRHVWQARQVVAARSAAETRHTA